MLATTPELVQLTELLPTQNIGQEDLVAKIGFSKLAMVASYVNRVQLAVSHPSLFHTPYTL